MAHKRVYIPSLHHHIVLVPREQLRRRKDVKQFRIPRVEGAPTPPAGFSFATGKFGKIQYPILGNDEDGDCWYVAALHQVQTWTGNVGQQAVFDAAAVVARYLKLSGGDNGLSDSQMIPEWKSGILGPNGPHKILDDLLVNPNDDAAALLAMYRFCGLSYTAALPDAWVANPKPGDIWGPGTPNQGNGHAMHLSGKVNGNYEDQTWAFDPPIQVTPAGLKGSDPELVVSFSLEMYNSAGISPAGFSYDDDALLWRQCGGIQLPPNPFVVTPPTPVPPTPTPGPGPSPLPGPTVQQRIDAMFAALEARYARVPYIGAYIVQALKTANLYVDRYLNGSQHKGKLRMDMRVPPSIIALIDQAFDAAIKANPQMALVLIWLKKIFDQCLPQL